MRPLPLRAALLLVPLIAVSLLAHGKSKHETVSPDGATPAPGATPKPGATPFVNVWEKQQAVKVAKKYDKNKNGKIDPEEADGLRREFAAKPDGFLKFYDTNHDGKLDDVEVDSIKLPHKEDDPAKKKKRKTKPLFGQEESAAPAGAFSQS